MVNRMKVNFSRFRGKELFLLLIIIACTTVLLWSWERTPLLATLLPPKLPMQVPQDLTTESHVSLVSSEPQLHGTKNDDGSQSSHASSYNDSNTPIRDEDIEVNKQQVQEVEKDESSDSSSRLTEETYNKKAGEENENRKQESDTASPVGSANASFSNKKNDKSYVPVILENQACNYAKGKWIPNNNRSLYSGFDCKQWLSPMWACRFMQRKDFAYEKLQWQPKDCVMEEFEGHKFLKRMHDKTLAFVGDSLGRQQFQSLMCMITGGKDTPDTVDVGEEYGFIAPTGSARPSGWAYRFPRTNTTILYHWSSCLCDLEPINITNPQTEYAMHLDRPPAFLRFFLHKIDVLVLNTGHHWNRGKLKANRWVMFVGGKPNSNRKLAMIGDAKNFTIHSIVDWVNLQLPKHPRLKAFYRSISPRHFVNGDWNTGGSCDNTTPMSIGKEVLQDESSDYIAGNAVKGTGVKLLDITALSQLRDEGHISRFSITASPGVHDCLHWCLPGVPDTWNEILFAQIVDTEKAQDS